MKKKIKSVREIKNYCSTVAHIYFVILYRINIEVLPLQQKCSGTVAAVAVNCSGNYSEKISSAESSSFLK